MFCAVATAFQRLVVQRKQFGSEVSRLLQRMMPGQHTPETPFLIPPVGVLASTVDGYFCYQ